MGQSVAACSEVKTTRSARLRRVAGILMTRRPPRALTPVETWNAWNTIAMAAWRASGGSEEGFAEFDSWSAKWPQKYDAGETRFRWDHLRRSPPDKALADSALT
jgi:Primase C terminal 2 (PriCT-2)